MTTWYGRQAERLGAGGQVQTGGLGIELLEHASDDRVGVETLLHELIRVRKEESLRASALREVGRQGVATALRQTSRTTEAGTPVCSSITLEVLRSPGKVERTRSPSGMVARTVRTSCGGVVMSARIWSSDEPTGTS